jgi:hypothetical protein
MNPESERLKEKNSGPIGVWEKWGPYVAERAWGTVREDYSADGDAWNYFPYEHARMRAYRRGEDGIAGFCDRYQVIVFSPAFWNGQDSTLKERLFGLNSYEGNHGEDVKEIYYYLDATPTASYLKYLYKYPQAAYPYRELLEVNGKRGPLDREYELIDTGIFDEDRYFDIFIEYAKAGPEDICIRIEALNRGPDAAPLHMIPQLWFRNQWSWGHKSSRQPLIKWEEETPDQICISADDTGMPSPHYLVHDYHLGQRYLYGSPGAEALFTNNDSNTQALWNQPNSTPYVKDAFHRYLIQGEKGAVNPQREGTKSAFHYFFPSVAPGKSVVVRLRLSPKKIDSPLQKIDEIVAQRKSEADQFYASIHPKQATEEEKMIQRQAFAGMIWNKQIYIFSVGNWLEGDDPLHPPPLSHKTIRNVHWRHIVSMRIMSMPDKWEYPWFAAWDLTFQALVFGLIDIEFAKNQAALLLFDQFQHPNGAIPAYEWEFSDINPPLQAWAALKLFELEKKKFGREDFDFLEKCFHKLLLNFAWWVNKVDSLGNNIFEGGFLGMDNIGFADRSEKPPPGYMIDQADGSGWMSLLCLNMMKIALILAQRNPNYENLGNKFFQHFVYVTAAMRKGYWRHYDMFDEKDGFFYSYLRCPDGSVERVPIRSLVGIVPFFAFNVWEDRELKKYPEFYKAYEWMVQKKGDLTEKCVQRVACSSETKHVFGLLTPVELEKFLQTIWSPQEFRSRFGLRSLSKYHERHPAEMQGFSLAYEPGEALEKIKGGNSNWRGPIWFPLNYLLIETLIHLGSAFKDSLQIQVCGEKGVTLEEMGRKFAESLIALFKRDEKGNRPIYDNIEKFQKDPHFKDYILFYEHFHGEDGRGLGASHQTGWTGIVAALIDEFRNQ